MDDLRLRQSGLGLHAQRTQLFNRGSLVQLCSRQTGHWADIILCCREARSAFAARDNRCLGKHLFPEIF